MNYKITLSNAALKFYNSLNKTTQTIIKDALKDLLKYYETGEPKNLDISKMTEEKYHGFFRLRTGSYRIVYMPRYKEMVVFILNMDKRQDVYKK